MAGDNIADRSPALAWEGAMARILVAVFGFCLLVLGASPAAHAAKRVAFVVGIDSYDNLPEQQQLKKAVNDAQAIGEALVGLGYDVQKADNVGRTDFLRQWQLFLNRLDPGDEAAVFFAGHGVEIDGQNFLLPRDVPRVASGEEEVLKGSGLSLAALLDQVRDRHPQVGLYILDACRDNPFVDGKGRGIGGTRGLARVEPPSGTFIMFSAGAKESALDRLSDNDPNPNSIYTRTLLPRLKASGRITDIARDVRREVRELAASVAHVQTPAYYDEVVGDFCPAGCEAKTTAAQPQIAPAEIPRPQAEAEPAKAPAAPSSLPAQTAALTPQAVQVPAPGHAPVDECDRLAADANNPDSVAPAVDYETLEPAKAIPACEAAVRAYPNERRFGFQLGRAYHHAKKYDLAKQQFETLSNNGYPIATSYLAFLYTQGNGVEKDEGKALSLIRQAADSGDAIGALALGSAYEWGQYGVAKNEAEALRWYEKAAERGNVRAALVLGEKYSEGKLGLAKDDAEAARLFRKAAERGDVQGLYYLGLSHWEGRGLPKDQTQAEALFAKGDERKNSHAMVDIGRKFESGQGVAENDAEGLKWFRKAAELGDQYGMFYVGLMYRYGQGVAKDSAEATRWYRKAAELGDTTAMTGLAEMYATGEGVPVDAAEAARWRDAAKSGSVPTGTATPSVEDDKGDTEVAAVAPNTAVELSKRETRSAVDPSLLRSFGPFEHDVVSIAFSPDGKRMYALVSGGYFMKLDPASGEVGAELGLVAQRACCRIVVSPDGKYLVSGNYDNLVLIWDAETGAQLRSFNGHSDYVASVAFSPDGNQIASASYDGTIRIWNVGSGKQVRSLNPRVGKAYSVAFSPDGKSLASGHTDGDIKVWDVAGGRLLNSEKANDYGVYSLEFTPDGTRLLSTGADAKVRVWDLAGKKEVTSFGEGYSSLCCLAISPDSRTVAAGGSDNLVRLWDLATGSLLDKLEHSNWIQSIVFSPDGSQLASGANDKTVKLWDMGGAKAAAR
jgi:TPR repeat protein